MVHIFIYLTLIETINLPFVSKSFNEVVNGYKEFEDRRNLAKTVIDRKKLNECFMNHFEEVIIRFCGQFTFNTTLYLIYSLELQKLQFYTSDVLTHLFFCNRSQNSNEGNSRSCSRLFANGANDFVSKIRYHFTDVLINAD